ncbi:MAG: hypothetical protein Q9184_002531 [Pyrenodesmia sp. 2 TL-2023]
MPQQMPQTQWTASIVKASTQLMVSGLTLAQLWTSGSLTDVLHQGFFLLFMGLLSLLYLICALRTNMVFVTIFFGLFMCFVFLTGSYWNIAVDQAALGAKLQIASGAFAFLACLAGWWIFFAQMLASVDFPFQMPVGDISHLIRSGTERAQQKERFSA